MDEIYEVGVLMTEDVQKNTITHVTKELNTWEKVFKTLKELTGEPTEDSTIDFVSSGSLQFFMDHAPAIATTLSAIIAGVVKVFQKINELQQIKEQLKALKLTPTVKQLEKQEKQTFADEIDKVAMDVIKQFAANNIEKERLNEITIAVKGHVRYVAKCLNNGITIEINPPEPEYVPSDKETDTDEEKEKKKNLKEKAQLSAKRFELVHESMELLKSVGKPVLSTMKYLTDGDKEEDKDESNEK